MKHNETPSQRLKKLRLEAGFKTAADAARRHKWHAVTYRSHESNHRGFGIPKWAAEEYAKTYGVSLDYLMTGKEATLSPRKIEQIGRLSIVVCHVSIVAWDQVRHLFTVDKGEMLQILQWAEASIPIASEVTLGPLSFAVQVPDDAMRSHERTSFQRGDWIVVDSEARVKPGDYCLAEVADEELPVLRRYAQEGLGIIRLEPLNPTFPTYWIKPGGPGRVLGRLMLLTLRL